MYASSFEPRFPFIGINGLANDAKNEQYHNHHVFAWATFFVIAYTRVRASTHVRYGRKTIRSYHTAAATVRSSDLRTVYRLVVK